MRFTVLAAFFVLALVCFAGPGLSAEDAAPRKRRLDRFVGSVKAVSGALPKLTNRVREAMSSREGMARLIREAHAMESALAEAQERRHPRAQPTAGSAALRVVSKMEGEEDTSNDDRAADIANRYGASSSARAIRNSVPRFGFPTEIDDDDPAQYAIGIGILFGIGIFFAVLTLIVFIFFVVCRICCNCKCCGGRSANPEGYTPKQRWYPLIALMCFIVLAAVFAILGLAFSEEAHSDVVASDQSLLKSAPNLVDDGIGLVDRIRIIISSFETNLNDIVATVVALAASSGPIVRDGTAGIDTRLTAMEATLTGVEFTVGGITYECDFCNDAASDIADIRTQISTLSDDTLEDLAEVVDTVEMELTDQVAEILDDINEADGELRDGRRDLAKANNELNPIIDDVEEYDNTRRILMIVLFLIPLSAVVFAIVGALLKKGWPFSILYWLTWLVMFVMWLLFAIHLPAAVVTGDACNYLDVHESNWRETLDENSNCDDPGASSTCVDPGELLDACLDDTPLVEVLNLTDDLDFRELIEFDVLEQDPASFLNFTELDMFATDVAALDVTTFGLDPSVPATYVDAANAITMGSPVVTAMNFASLDFAAEGFVDPQLSTLNGFQTAHASYVSALDTATGLLDSIKMQTTDLVDYVDELKQNISDAVDSVSDIEVALQPLFDNVDALIDLARCGFVGDFYRNVKIRMCDDIVTDLSIISLSLFFLAILAIPILCLSIRLAKRMGKPMDEDFEDEDAMELDRMPNDGNSTSTKTWE